MNDKTTLILITIALVISVAVSAYINHNRMMAEKTNNVVELTADYGDIERLSAFEKVPIPQVLEKLRNAGITSVALTEDLAGNVDINFLSGADPKKLNIYIPGKGLSKDKTGIIQNSGLRVIPRVRNSFSISREFIIRKIRDISQYGTVIFAEEEVLGYPNYLKETAKAIGVYGMRYGFVEFGKQLGDTDLSSYMGGSLVKVHSIPPDEMEGLLRQDMVKRYLRAARERAVRIVYVHLLSYPDNGKDLVETNTAFIAEIKKELLHDNFIVGKASSQKGIRVTKLQKNLIGLGVASGTVLLLVYFTSVNIYFAFIILVLIALLPVKYLALTAAVVFPSYAVISQFPIKKVTFEYGFLTKSIVIVINIVGITAVGAIYISALLADKISMLGIEGFSGVKIAFILPILIVATYFFLRREDGKLDIQNSLSKLKEFLDIHITIFHFIMFLIIAAAGALLILRSGNFGIPIPGPEKLARKILEEIMIVRPRTKEFLIGYPAIIIAAVYYLRGGSKWLWLLLAAGVLAPISMINSFCHIHTPLFFSVVRSAVGMVLGMGIGLSAYFLWDLRPNK